MTSNDLLMVAIEQLARLERDWCEDGSDEIKRPLKITTHWYKPAMDEKGSSHVIAIQQKPTMSKIKKPKLWNSADCNSKGADVCNDMNKNKSASKIKTTPPTPKNRNSSTSLGHLKGTAHSSMQKTKPPIQTLSRSSSRRKIRPRREERSLEQNDGLAESKIIFREVRWSEPSTDRRRRETAANTSAKRQPQIFHEKHTDPQLIKPAKKKKSINKPPQKVFVSIPEPASCEGVDLARRPPRPRSPSLTRPRPRMRVPVQLYPYEEVCRREDPPDIWKDHRRSKKSDLPRRTSDQAQRTTTVTVRDKQTASVVPYSHHPRRHVPAHPRQLSTAPTRPQRKAENHQRPSTRPPGPYQPVYGYDYWIIPAPAPNQHQYQHQYQNQRRRSSTRRLHQYAEPSRQPNHPLSQEDYVQWCAARGCLESPGW